MTSQERGVIRVRLPMWGPETYYRYKFGDLWGYLFDRTTQEAIGEPTPQKVYALHDETDDYEIYTGAYDVSDH